MAQKFDVTTINGIEKVKTYMQHQYPNGIIYEYIPDGQKLTNTTSKYVRQGLTFADKYGWLPPFTPYWAVWKLGQGVWNLTKKLTDVQDTIESQKDAVLDIIRAGKEKDVAELEVTMDEKAGLSFGSVIEGFPVEIVAGKSGKVTLKVRYK